MRSHFSLSRGVATACAVASATGLYCERGAAQALIAADYATNSIYQGGWTAGQNGGYGFGAWSIDYTGGTSPPDTLMNVLDTNSPCDPFGTAWALFTPQGTTPSPVNSPGGSCVTAPTGTDISRAGRAFPNGGLQPGQTFSTVIANPTCRTFYRGYTIVLSNGGDNIQYGGAGAILSVGTFEYFSYGRWYASGENGHGGGYTGTTLFDTDTGTNGMRLDVTITDTNSYHIVMTPLANPAIAFSEDGNFATNGPITWVTYQLYNTDSDFYPTAAACGPHYTDFYIRSMTVSGLTLNIQRSGANIILTWPTNFPNLTLKSSPSLGTAAVWNPVTPAPVVVNDLNVVTNPIVGPQQFYQLRP